MKSIDKTNTQKSTRPPITTKQIQSSARWVYNTVEELRRHIKGKNVKNS